MPLESGTRLGPYELLAPLGDGSEERYKASDSRRNQIVALKILPPEFSSSPEMKARLEKDAQTISSLKLPQICAFIEVGHHDPATDFIVSEFVEGETLAQQLARGALELHDALNVAIAIAGALDKAHRRGIVHGGLNPSLVIPAADGAKLLDFGVAQVAQGGGAVDSVSIAATRTSLSLLSAVPSFAAPYMAPEQYAAGAVDARTDIFSFGAILYEMVTGKKAFQEKTQALLIAAVQTVDPEPASALRPETPPALDYVITRCLGKDPKQRFQTIFDVTSELRWIARDATPTTNTAPTSITQKTRDRALWVGSAVAAVIALMLVPRTLVWFERAPERAEVRFVAAALPAGTAPVTLSPDGHWLTASINAGSLIGLPLDSVTPQTLVAGIPFQPFWSADSRSMAYFDQDGKLYRADIGGGPPQIICESPSRFAAGTWNRDGVILFPAAGLINRVLAAGGQPMPITTLDQSNQETEHLGPAFLPDGRHFLFLAVSSQPEKSAIYVGSLDSAQRTRLFASESLAQYAAPGYVLFNRGDTVFAQGFDADALVLKGEPIRVASGVPLRVAAAANGSSAITRSANFAVSQTGVLAYRTGATGRGGAATIEEQRSLFWIDRTGQKVTPIGITAAYVGLDVSPDGKRLAFHRHEGTGGDSWLFDLAQERTQRFTFDAAQDNSSPIWSPDGARIAFASRRGNKNSVYVKPSDGAAVEELIIESATGMMPMSWSPDGKLLLYVQNTGSGDIWAVPVTGDKKPFPLLQDSYTETFPQVSPDGKWLAYMSNQTGRAEIYVRPFPQGSVKWQVSTDGGNFPRWRRDGKELYFFFNNNIFASDIRVNGASIESGVPHTLFALPQVTAAVSHAPYLPFAVTADGQRFLVSQLGARAAGGGGVADAIISAVDQGTAIGGGPVNLTNPVTVVLNWTQMLKGK